jgi:hypothetical protein
MVRSKLSVIVFNYQLPILNTDRVWSMEYVVDMSTIGRQCVRRSVVRMRTQVGILRFFRHQHRIFEERRILQHAIRKALLILIKVGSNEGRHTLRHTLNHIKNDM